VGDRRTLARLGLTGAMRRWPPGSTVVVRQHRHARFRAVTPMVLVEDQPSRTLLYVPRGTRFLAPADRSGRVTRSICDEVGTTPDHWRDHAALHIVPGGAAFAVMVRWRQSFEDFAGFYVNVQEPLRQTDIGFDSMDQTLDVLIAPDRSQVLVKDEDELHDAARRGFFSAAEVAEIRAAAHTATEMVLDRLPPFDEPWHRWRPDPTWSAPQLPDDWASEPLSPSPWI
jgi:hypothetical protein